MLNPTRKDAASFVDKVKSQCETREYDRFLNIMRDLQGDVISPREVVLQIAALFKGYPDLAREFNVFLPPGYSLQPEGEGKSQLYFVEQT